MDAFTTTFERLAEADSLSPMRLGAARRFLEQGVPTPAGEAWKYTNLAKLAKTPFRPASPGDEQRVDAGELARLALATELPGRIVIVNGGLRADLSDLASLPEGVSVTAHTGADALADALGSLAPAEDAFSALNAAFLGDGIVIDVAEGAAPDRPLHVLFVGASGDTPLIRQPRVVVRAAGSSTVHLIEEYVGLEDDAGLTNVVTDVEAAAGASVFHHRLQVEAATASHIGRVNANVGAGASFHSDSVAFGANLARVDIDVALAERAARCRLNGLFVANGAQHVDHHTRVDHLVGDTHSEELYRGVLDDRSRGVFNGKVVVSKNAQQISARQTSNNLLLSRQAEIDTKPELEIYADDVTCAHGATVGELNPLELFYLRSRGLGEREARALLTYAFAERVVRDIPVAGVRQWVEQRFIGHRGYSEMTEALRAS